MSLTTLFSLLAFLSPVLLLTALVWSIRRPASRIWPPPSRASWQYWFTWILIVLAAAGIAGLGVLDWGSGPIPFPIRLFGGVIAATGGLVALAAILRLGSRTTQGLGGSLTTDGIYRYSRNPQYVGDAVMLTGFAIAANSLVTLLAAVLASICLLLTPFAEEPWLRAQHGDEYDAYLSRVPRYLTIWRPRT
jgi:protein-S-isoprenylcysteine O-methyltransferase Ste14